MGPLGSVVNSEGSSKQIIAVPTPVMTFMSSSLNSSGFWGVGEWWAIEWKTILVERDQGGGQASREGIQTQGNQIDSSRAWDFSNQKPSYWDTRHWEDWELGCINTKELQYCHKMPQILRMKIWLSPESRAYLNQQLSGKRAQWYSRQDVGE